MRLDFPDFYPYTLRRIQMASEPLEECVCFLPRTISMCLLASNILETIHFQFVHLVSAEQWKTLRVLTLHRSHS